MVSESTRRGRERLRGPEAYAHDPSLRSRSLQEPPAHQADQLVGGLPIGNWSRSDIGSIAARLVDLLPPQGANAVVEWAKPADHPKTEFRSIFLMVCIALGTLAFYVMM